MTLGRRKLMILINLIQAHIHCIRFDVIYLKQYI